MSIIKNLVGQYKFNGVELDVRREFEVDRKRIDIVVLLKPQGIPILIIETKRKENGLPTLKEAGREPTYIATAADVNHQLGVNNLDKVKLIRV